MKMITIKRAKNFLIYEGSASLDQAKEIFGNCSKENLIVILYIDKRTNSYFLVKEHGWIIIITFCGSLVKVFKDSNPHLHALCLFDYNWEFRFFQKAQQQYYEI